MLVFVFGSCLGWSLWGASTGEPGIPPLHNSQHAQEVHVHSRGATSVECHRCEGRLQEKGRGEEEEDGHTLPEMVGRLWKTERSQTEQTKL